MTLFHTFKQNKNYKMVKTDTKNIFYMSLNIEKTNLYKKRHYRRYEFVVYITS